MPDIHLFQWVVVFGGALWLTARWLLTRPQSRWRHIVAGIAATLLWIPTAYTANNVHVATDAGETVAFGSGALATVATFMVVVSIAGLVVGLFLWVEESVDDVSGQLPQNMRTGQRPRRGDD